MGEKQILSEPVNPDLLSESNLYTIVLLEEGEEVSRYENAVELKSPYEFDASRFLPNTTPMSLPRFFEIASQVIEDAQKREGVLEDQRVHLIEEYPPDPIHTFCEAIAWKVVRREPANMNTKATSRPQRKSTWWYDLKSKYHPNKVIIVESRPVDHTIEFSCWARTNRLANSRALWLEKLFINHAWAFETQGCERFFWKDRGSDNYTTIGDGKKAFYRPLNFFVRFREFEQKTHPMLKTIDFEIKIDS